MDVFFARAVDFRNEDQLSGERTSIEAKLREAGLIMVDPLLSEPPNRDPITLVQHDLKLLASSSAMLALMTIPNRNYIGVCCELVYANVLHIPTFVCVGESDYAARPFLQYHSTFIGRTVEECISRICKHCDKNR